MKRQSTHDGLKYKFELIKMKQVNVYNKYSLCGLPLNTNKKLIPKLLKWVEPGAASNRQYASKIAKPI